MRAATAWLALGVLAAVAARAPAEEDAADGDFNCTGHACLDDDDPPCPPDSMLAPTVAPDTTIAPTTPRGEDASTVGVDNGDGGGAGSGGAASLCVCAPGRCVTPVCRHGSIRELKQRGTGTPGDCCDVYQCVPPREKNCSAVVCPEEPAPCPPDSFRLPGRRGPHDCCSVPQGCQCLPRACAPPLCPAGATARTLRPGDGRPGSCCPEYDCSPPEVPPPPAPSNAAKDDDEIVNVIPHDKVRSGGRGVRSHPPLEELEPLGTQELMLEETTALVDTSTTGGGRGTAAACALDGRSLEHGLSLHKDACTVCACTNGSMTCETRGCPLLPADCQPVFVDGECCPTCKESSVGAVHVTSGGCVTAAGRPVPEGQRWQEDPCTPCECRGGVRRCEAFMCQVACARPRNDPRECCPVCDEECPLECPSGFVLDRLGKPLCLCAPTPACPPLQGCNKNCTHGLRTNRQGCPICRCNQCKPLRPPDCERTCPHGFLINERGCAICKCKESPDQLSMSANAVTPSCKSSDGETREDGESWFDGCRQCHCVAGAEMCALVACPPLNCSSPVYGPGDECCPHCPDELQRGVASSALVAGSGGPAAAACPVGRAEGEQWRADACARCVCRGGRTLCEAAVCPPAPCDTPVRPRAPSCCPECPLTHLTLSEDEGARPCGRRAHGSTWREARDCRSCVCVDGAASCFTERCPHTPCARPLLPKNRCCPICLNDYLVRKQCWSGNSTYQQGEEWIDDQCTRCTCNDGHITCEPKKCHVLCENPITLPNQCCPVCPDMTEYTTSTLLHEWEYQLIIVIISVVMIFLIISTFYQCYKKRQLKMDLSPKSCPNPAYNAYSNRNSFPMPRYICADHQSKSEPYQYKYVPTYDTQPFDLLKSSSIGASEKTALAPV